MSLYSNYIRDTGAQHLKLPPSLKDLNIGHNYIQGDIFQSLPIPAGLESIWYGRDGDLTVSSSKLNHIAQSKKGRYRYARIEQYFHVKRCFPLWIEMCRGLLFGVPNDRIFQFLQSIPGSKNIRQLIILFSNPYNHA